MDREIWQQIIRVMKRTSPKEIHDYVLATKVHICGNEAIFEFIAGLKGVEGLDLNNLLEQELDDICSMWYEMWKEEMKYGTYDVLYERDDRDDMPYEEVFDEFQSLIEENKIKFSKRDTLNVAIKKAESEPYPPETERFKSPNYKLVIALGYQLQLLQGDEPFWLSGADAGLICGKSQPRGAQILRALVRRRAFKLIEPGTNSRAARYKYIFNRANVKPKIKEQAN